MAENVTPSNGSPDAPSDELFNTLTEGTFQQRTDEGLLFDLGDGRKALVPAEEFGDELPFEEGTAQTLLVEQPVGDYWVASIHKAEKLAVWDWLEEAQKTGEEVEGTILGENKGGLSVDIGLRAFLPRSHVDLHRVDDVSPYIGRQGRFQIIQFDKKRGNVVVSRRKVLEQEVKAQRRETLAEIEPGAEFEGVVRNLTNFGAFVDIGGIDGLLHVSNMSWGRVDHPSELVRPGDKIRVVVLDYDKKKKRLSLGRKQLLEDPWENISERYSEGDVVTGKVVSLADFGAFVEVEPGLEGLVHVTELAWTGRINHPKEVLNLEQEVQVKVIGIDMENRRLGLSIKRLEANPWEELAEQLSPGTRIQGTIRNITDFGLFVEVAPQIEGLVHVSDLSWTEKIENPREHYTVGQEVEVVVLEVDAEAERISLGIKQLSDDPWKRAAEIARPGRKIDVTITRLTEFGAFAEIVPGVEGLIHISELSPERVEQVQDVVRPGQTVQALVMSFDAANQRISLSLKRDELSEEEGEAREYIEEAGATSTLGDILRDRLGLQSSDEMSADEAAPEEEAEAEAAPAEEAEAEAAPEEAVEAEAAPEGEDEAEAKADEDEDKD